MQSTTQVQYRDMKRPNGCNQQHTHIYIHILLIQIFFVAFLQWLEWHQGAPVLLAGTTDGDVWMWKISSGDCKTFQGHGCACGTGTILPDGVYGISS